MTLQDCHRSNSSARPLLCTGTTLFRDLSPGTYLLTLCRGGSGIRLLLRLPPDTNLSLRYDPVSLRYCWRKDPFPFF